MWEPTKKNTHTHTHNEILYVGHVTALYLRLILVLLLPSTNNNSVICYYGLFLKKQIPGPRFHYLVIFYFTILSVSQNSMD